MKTFARCIALLTLWLAAAAADAVEKTPARLFILSGQSNMARLNPDLSFTPTVKKAFEGSEQVIVVKFAVGGRPIRQWYRKWKPAPGKKVNRKMENGALYDRTMAAVEKALAGKDLDIRSVTFVWMQGERDAREGHHEVYAESLKGLIEQFRSDLKRPDMTAVIGRLSDCRNQDPNWVAVRKAQVAVAEGDPLVTWVDTDDLNGPQDALHYTKPGYVELGKRFAEAAIGLVKKP